MTSTTAALLEFFVIGVATPLTAVCVLPLYPAFIAYLGTVSAGERKRSPVLLGVLVVAGVLSFMLVIGSVWTLAFGAGVADAVETVSPIAFAVLAVVGGVLLVDPRVFARLPSVEPPHSSRPNVSAFGYGFFFGAIVIPCNPGLITLFFTRATVVFPALESRITVLLAFLAFGLGMGAPLLAFAVLSEAAGERITRALARRSNQINRGVGLVLIAVAGYYLWVVFDIIPVVGTVF